MSLEKISLRTKRLILRPWEESDAEGLYLYAKDPRVGPKAGWPPHKSVENSRYIIEKVLSSNESYAVVLKEENKIIGGIAILFGNNSNMKLEKEEGELGYWLGVPYWGKGLIPEAAEKIIRHGFEELGLINIWAGYFDGNEQSKRVLEKCGFKYHHTDKDKYWPLMKDIRTEHIVKLTKTEWENRI